MPAGPRQKVQIRVETPDLIPGPGLVSTSALGLGLNIGPEVGRDPGSSANPSLHIPQSTLKSSSSLSHSFWILV